MSLIMILTILLVLSIILLAAAFFLLLQEKGYRDAQCRKFASLDSGSSMEQETIGTVEYEKIGLL